MPILLTLTEVCMKKFLFAFMCLAVCGNAFAKDHKKGFVFIPENVVIETVENVKTKSDETFVYMQGQIVKALGDDKYAFTDKTGEIVLEIDNDEFDGVTVAAGEFIEVSGEIDKDMMKPAKVDVKSIKKLNENKK